MTSWKEDIIESLKRLGGEAHLSEIYNDIKLNTKRILSQTYEATIRATLERYSSDSDAYNQQEDLFFIVSEKGEGKWGLR